MPKTDLLELIKNGESSGVEFKRDDVRPEHSPRRSSRWPTFRAA
jgi:ATP-dependent DNA helicase RecG